MKLMRTSSLNVTAVLLALALAGAVPAQERASDRADARPEATGVPRLVKFGDALRDGDAEVRRQSAGALAGPRFAL